jgi:hypothetical protein
MTVPLSEQIRCIEREIGMRHRVFPRWVTAQRMTQKKADEEILAMQAVLETLQKIEAEGRLI